MSYPRRISDIKPLFTNLAQTSHYEVQFGGLSRELLAYLAVRGVDAGFIYRDAGLLCSSTSIPTFQLGSGEIYNHIGVQEKFAYSKNYSQVSMEFYVDNDYKIIKFMEHWMEFISSGSHNPIDGVSPPVGQESSAYFVRMQYPSYYKSDSTKLIKFERDYFSEIEYNFIGLFPLSISSMPVSYTASNILTMGVTFQFDRYIAGRKTSDSIYQSTDNNKQATQIQTQQDPGKEPLVPISPGAAGAGGVRFVRRGSTPYETASEQYFDIQGTRRAP